MKRVAKLTITFASSFLIGLVILAWFLYRPGGPLNPHRWASTVAEEHFKGTKFSMFEFDLTDSGDGDDHPKIVLSVNLDVCLAHGELRILERHSEGLSNIDRPKEETVSPQVIVGMNFYTNIRGGGK